MMVSVAEMDTPAAAGGVQPGNLTLSPPAMQGLNSNQCRIMEGDVRPLLQPAQAARPQSHPWWHPKRGAGAR